MDKAKEALFNILSNRISFPETTLLDLFSGTGSIAFEFISRGGESAICVEKNAQNASEIARNATILGIKNLRVVTYDAFAPKETLGSFGLIFADPPYDAPQIPILPSKIIGSGLLAPDGLLIVEHKPGIEFQYTPPDEIRKYSHAVFSFFSRTK